jgi:heme o synthase
VQKANTARTISMFDVVSQKIRDYQQLTKFTLALLVVFSAVMAYLIAKSDAFTWGGVVVLSLGGFLVTGAANALNQVIEKDYDKLMKRTENRPLVTGNMSASEGLLVAGLMSLVGVSLLSLFNPLTGLIGMLSLILYAFVYTPLKRITPLSVVVGAIPGALPTFIGCVAAEGKVSFLAWLLFGIQFFWQFPHFWAIAWLADEDYKRADFYLLPTKSGEKTQEVGWNSFLYACFLLPLSIAPYFFGYNSAIAVGICTLTTLIYMYYSWVFYTNNDRLSARKLMFCSFFYLPTVLIVLVIDKILF